MPNRRLIAESEEEEDGQALFVKDGAPVKFCFHQSVTRGREQIRRDVERHGGQIVEDERQANVLLVDEEQDVEFLQRMYYSSTEAYKLSLYVEPRGFVQQCVRAGDYQHVAPAKRGMPGRPRGERRPRVAFTEDDRERLAYYLATRFPTRDGRMGNKAYKELERFGQTDDPSWEWVKRHTWHSWREHYKMHPDTMDVRVDRFLQELKDKGHHFGHDTRSHEHGNGGQLRPDEEEEEEEEEGEEERPRQKQKERSRQKQKQKQRLENNPKRKQKGEQRENRRRRQEDSPEVAEQRLPTDSPGNEKNPLVCDDDDDEQSRRIKRHRAHSEASCQHGSLDSLTKRARVPEASLSQENVSDAEVNRGKGGSDGEEDNNTEKSLEIEGNDLFGDREYGSQPELDDDKEGSDHELQSELDGVQDHGFPIPHSPQSQTRPVSEQQDLSMSTQATLVPSPSFRISDPAPTPTPTKRGVAEATTLPATSPPSLQRTLATPKERPVVRRMRVRGSSAQPGSSKTGGNVPESDAPYQNTRARSRSVEPQSQPIVEGQSKRKHKGKEKAKEVLAAVEEDMHVETDELNEGSTRSIPASGSLTTQDEMVVEMLLRDTVSQDVESDDSDGDMLPDLPRFQEVEVEDEVPSDSDDAETHKSLMRGATQDQDGDDVARVERMASSTFAVKTRLTRSMGRIH